MKLSELRLTFERTKRIEESALLATEGIAEIEGASPPFCRDHRAFCVSVNSRILLLEEELHDKYFPLSDAQLEKATAELHKPIRILTPQKSTPFSSLTCFDSLLDSGEWASVAQSFRLSSGNFGKICTLGTFDPVASGSLAVAYCASAVTDRNGKLLNCRILATRPCFPPAPAKELAFLDSALALGMLEREDGAFDLFTLCGANHLGRIKIDYPFEGFGDILEEVQKDPEIL